MTKPIPPLDLSWLLIESPAGTTHVGAMLLFKKPSGRAGGTPSPPGGPLPLPPRPPYDALLRLVADLHEPQLDRDRPLFRCWVIDGVPDGMFAIYTKTHHSIIDGESGLKLLYAGLSTTDGRAVP